MIPRRRDSQSLSSHLRSPSFQRGSQEIGAGLGNAQDPLPSGYEIFGMHFFFIWPGGTDHRSQPQLFWHRLLSVSPAPAWTVRSVWWWGQMEDIRYFWNGWELVTAGITAQEDPGFVIFVYKSVQTVVFFHVITSFLYFITRFFPVSIIFFIFPQKPDIQCCIIPPHLL